MVPLILGNESVIWDLINTGDMDSRECRRPNALPKDLLSVVGMRETAYLEAHVRKDGGLRSVVLWLSAPNTPECNRALAAASKFAVC